MTGTNVIEMKPRTEWSLDHPKVRELWCTTNEAHVTIADAIEEAAGAGVPGRDHRDQDRRARARGGADVVLGRWLGNWLVLELCPSISSTM